MQVNASRTIEEWTQDGVCPPNEMSIDEDLLPWESNNGRVEPNAVSDMVRDICVIIMLTHLRSKHH